MGIQFYVEFANRRKTNPIGVIAADLKHGTNELDATRVMGQEFVVRESCVRGGSVKPRWVPVKVSTVGGGSVTTVTRNYLHRRCTPIPSAVIRSNLPDFYAAVLSQSVETPTSTGDLESPIKAASFE